MGAVQLATLLCLVACHTALGVTTPSTTSPEDRIQQLESVTKQLARQLMLQQLYVEEKTRSEGDSGLKQVRMRKDGAKSYHVANWASKAMASMHDHSDLINTCGMGELIAVLNGVEFRTRHNDYKLKMASTTSGDYHATEDVPFPDVPPEVLNKNTVDKQIVEMREWFKAWKTSNTTHRDYRKYFRPVLCYLEGAWTNDIDLDEPFDSDRHQLEADSWFELQEQIRFTSFTGDKNNQENFAYLPTTLMSVENGVPIFGQWNYRILCNPIQGGLNLHDIMPLDNLASRLAHESTFDDYLLSRNARFHVNPENQQDVYKWGKLDELMSQIPGKDNHRANITDSVFGLTKYHLEMNEPLNTGFYNRWYRVREEGAMGSKTPLRGFSDRNLFVADSTQTRVAPMSVKVCKKRKRRKGRVCETVSKRVSYAIPLEIVFLTPLHKWNPFDVEYKGLHSSEAGLTVRADGRNGRHNLDKALNGTNSKNYYLTPVHFFSGGEVDKDTADTTRSSVGVLDRNGVVRSLKASGIRILLPEIRDVGVMRTRYPVMPVHAEGSPIWKEVEALRDVVMDMHKYLRYFQAQPGLTINDTAPPEPELRHVLLSTSSSNPAPVGLHAHTLQLTEAQAAKLMRKPKKRILVRTSEENGHSHLLAVKFDKNKQRFYYSLCDSSPRCFDGHPTVLESRTNSFLAP